MTRTSWQTLLADLALVLFMVTVGALVRAKHQHAPMPIVAAVAQAPLQEAIPLSVYRDLPGAPPLATWLAQQPRDARQQISVVVRYLPGAERALPSRVDAVLAAAVRSGVDPRIVVEPGEGGTSAGVGFDAAPMAQDLRQTTDILQHRTTP